MRVAAEDERVTSVMPKKIGKPALPEKRAVFATLWESSRGRFHEEPGSATRTPFQRDRDRIIHSRAFRRLEHKTQVFFSGSGEHLRTRLTHTMEVAAIARNIARALRINEDLTETIALAHDLGHAHAGVTVGELGSVGADVLDEFAAVMCYDLGLDLLHDVRPSDVDSLGLFCARHHVNYRTRGTALATELTREPR